MNSLEMTPEQARAARDSLGLSQRFIASETGINRSQLALFEVGKYNLEAFKRLALQYCYARLGYRFDGELPSTPNPVPSIPQAVNAQPKAAKKVKGAETSKNAELPRIIDGIVISGGNVKSVIDSTTAEIKSNDALIQRLAALPVKRSLWDDAPLTKERDEVIHLMARNYQLSRFLQSRAVIPVEGGNNVKNSDGLLNTVVDLVAVLLNAEIEQPAK